MTVVFALLLILVLLGCWSLTLLGLPGNWLMVVATSIYAYLVPAQSPATLGWRTVVAILVLAALGEIIELLAGAMGVSKTGGSRRSAVMALVGSIVGGILGVFIGVPIPLIGSVVAAVFFAGLGAMAGAVFSEISVGQKLGTSWRIGKAAFWGRLAGTLGKMLLGAAIIVVVVAAMLL
jgi:uncharacterized protein YqgC (DUF456 family)